ncbi:MAG: hypothetical protein ACTSRA_11500 [Promethearchaeota archaeon]
MVGYIIESITTILIFMAILIPLSFSLIFPRSKTSTVFTIIFGMITIILFSGILYILQGDVPRSWPLLPAFSYYMVGLSILGILNAVWISWQHTKKLLNKWRGSTKKGEKKQKTKNHESNNRLKTLGLALGVSWLVTIGISFISPSLIEYKRYTIDPANLDFSNFKISFWGTPSRNVVNSSLYNSTGDLELELLGDSGLNSTFYAGISPGYLLDPSYYAGLQATMGLFNKYGIKFAIHPYSAGDFPDDFNSPIWLSSVESLIPVISSLNLTASIQGFIFDIERSKRHFRERAEFVNQSSLPGIVAQGNYELITADREYHQVVVENITRVINLVHESLGNDFEMILTCQAPGMYDLVDHDADIQIFEQYTAYPPQWDINTWMFYFSSTPPPENHYKLFHLVRHQVILFGPQNSRVFLGEAGHHYYSGLDGIRNLAKDIVVCRYFGVDEVILFSYKYFLDDLGFQGLQELKYLFRDNISALEPVEFRIYLSNTLSVFAQYIIDFLLNFMLPSGFVFIISLNGVLLFCSRYLKHLIDFLKNKRFNGTESNEKTVMNGNR